MRDIAVGAAGTKCSWVIQRLDKETIVQGSLLCQAGGTQSLRPYHIWASMGSTKADRESDPAAIIAAVHDLVGKPGMALLDTLIPRRD